MINRMYLGDKINISWAKTIIGLWLVLIFVWPQLERTYDATLRPKPWIYAYLVVEETEDDEKPLIRYGIEVQMEAAGVWRAWTEIERSDGWVRSIQRTGSGSYSPERPDELIVSWDWFFGGDMPLPRIRFRVCVDYVLLTTKTGIPFTSGAYCSDPVTPT